MKVIIRQLSIDSDYIFRWWDLAKIYFDINDYHIVYECERPNDTTLEDIFYEFNCDHPSDYKGHSLSTSDVVQIDDKVFFCDDIGWEDITDIAKIV